MKKKLYEKVYDDIENKIISGDYSLGTTLPSEKNLIDYYGVSAITIKRALTELKESGYISRKPKEGSIIINNHVKKEIVDSPTNKSLVGVVLTRFDSSFGEEILNGILDNNPNNYEIIIKKSNGDTQREDELIRDLIEAGVEGIILLPTSSEFLSPNLLKMISNNFPFVVIDRVLDGLPVNSVTVNNEQTARTLTNYLFSNGHRNIGFLSSSTRISTVQEREKGFINSHAVNGLALNSEYIQHFITSDSKNTETEKRVDIRRIKEFLQKYPELTAILSTEYETALLVGEACRQLNLNIPNDISLVCYDHPISNFLKQPFIVTHIEQNQYEVGQESIRMLHSKIQDNSKIEKFVTIGVLAQGDSVKDISE
ncbi:hypothetical protein IGI37_003322 [Enterococcus sp. AZ194]|uniref:GntR family transcriptional regulator n=1 Tax=Enterococcus sp. AZ194 TaxID=2774629 RepID=UPI003F2575D2